MMTIYIKDNTENVAKCILYYGSYNMQMCLTKQAPETASSMHAVMYIMNNT